MIPYYRDAVPAAMGVSYDTLHQVCRELDKAYKNFYRLLKDKKATGIQTKKDVGHPKFKGFRDPRAFAFEKYAKGIKIDGRRVRIYGVGRVAVRWHRPLGGSPRSVHLKEEAGKWFICFACALPDPVPLEPVGTVIGLDMGISALITTDTGIKVEHPHFYRDAQKQLRIVQRKAARQYERAKQQTVDALKAQGKLRPDADWKKVKVRVKPSNNWKRTQRQIRLLHWHIANQRKTFLATMAYQLVSAHDLIAMEDLKVSNMVRNKHLSKSILDAGWGFFREAVQVKADDAGRKVVIVNPAYTSKTCSQCGHLFEDMTLATRWIDCPQCGLSMDRDQNAAVNILNRGLNDTNSLRVAK
jgi:putative transposase